MAAPDVAGIVAQLFQARPSASPAQVQHALKGTSYRFSDGAAYTSVGGYTTSFDEGTGLVDVVAATQSLTGASTADAVTVEKGKGEPGR